MRAFDPVKQLRKDKLRKLISIIQTNCHQMRDVNGGGLFLASCFVNHSCIPNCNFDVHGTDMSLYCIQPIAKGTFKYQGYPLYQTNFRSNLTV